MRLSQNTHDAVRALWAVGGDHGRPPTPTPEVDPWEDEDPLVIPRDEAIVDFPGTPDISVHLYGDMADTVTIEKYIDFETPRQDTLALVAALLAGDARRRPAEGKGPKRFLRELLSAPCGIVLTVPVGGDKAYEQRVPSQCYGLTWVTTLPEARPAPKPTHR